MARRRPCSPLVSLAALLALSMGAATRPASDAGNAGDAESARAAFLAYAAALRRGDAATARQRMTGGGPWAGEYVDALAEVAAAYLRVQRAAAERFGPAGEDLGLLPPMAPGVEAAEVKVSGDGEAATLLPRPPLPPVALRRVEGRWKVDLGPTPRWALEFGARRNRAVARALGDVAAEIAAGRYASAAAARQALAERQLAALRAAASRPAASTRPTAAADRRSR